MDDNQEHITNKNLKLSILLVCLLIIILSIVAFSTCGTQKQKVTLTGKCSDGLAVGDTKKVKCADGSDGEIIYVCQTNGQVSQKVSDTCQSKPAFSTLDGIETAMLSDLSDLDRTDQQFTRYAIATYKTSANAKQAVDKTLNQLVENKRIIQLTTPIANTNIFRFDLRDFELSRADWFRVENADKLNFESNTTKGQVIKNLTLTRKPWLHSDNLSDIVLFTSSLYYQFLNVSATINDLRTKLGVDFAGDLANLDASFIGTSNSTITNNKNRLITFLDSDDGVYSETFDTKPPLNAQRNLFQFPLLAETGSKLVFDFAASEVIYSLPNGLHGYGLYLANGNRVDAADVDVVRDNVSPVAPAPVIQSAISCSRCHASGFIPATDEIRDHVNANGSEFGRDDIDRVNKLYHVAADNQALFQKQNADYQAALKALNIGVDGVDPINQERDTYRLNWDSSQVAAFLFLTADEFSSRLNQSADGRAQVGQLLTGGVITFDQLVQVLPIFIKDFRLLEDPL